MELPFAESFSTGSGSVVAPHIYVRWMRPDDLPRALDIEFESFEFAWDEEEFKRHLKRWNVRALAADSGGQIVGYLVFALGGRKREILNVAVDHAYRRRGVGRALVETLLENMRAEGRETLYAEVGETNLLAHLFFRGVGFDAVQVVRNPFEGSDDDAYRFERAVTARQEPRQ